MSLKKESTRTAFAEALGEIMQKDSRVVMVSADSVSVFRVTELQKQFPDRIVEAGIAEQDAVMIAAGLASSGMIPFVCAYAGFLTMRACEQMRTFVGYPKLNIKFFGANGGMYSGEREGVTHQFFEDLGIMRAIPGYTVIAPADAKQAKRAVYAAYETEGPTFCRLGSGRDPVVYEEAAPDPLKADLIYDGGADVLIVGCGQVLPGAVEAAKRLGSARVLNMSAIKPLDEAALLPLLQQARRVVTVEDHTVWGGLGSAVCEYAAQACPRPVRRVGLTDYPESGPADELLVKYGLDADAIERAARMEL